LESEGERLVEKEILSQRFRHFAEIECKGSSELYEHLSINIAEDDELLELAAHTRPGQPVPNLLFGAVHYLLLKGKKHELREYYTSLVEHPKDVTESFSSFREFCLQNKQEIIPILQQKLVQTNEVRRCAYLYPVFCFIYDQVKKPLALVEIGTSAGFQLLWDQYSYSYETNKRYGNVESKVHITSEIKGNRQPFFIEKSPPVVQRIGIDLHINDLNNHEDELWLNALIWPEHKERRELFEKAASCVKNQPLQLMEGDGVLLLPDMEKQIPHDSVLCIFHTHVANQIPEERKKQLIENIRTIGQTREVFHLYNNMWDRKLHLDYFINKKEYKTTVGETDGHGRWFTWELSR
jgi:hypothetical protein